MDRGELLAAIDDARPGPGDDPVRRPGLFDDVLAEMETMVSGGDRCRWSPDEPWPRQG